MDVFRYFSSFRPSGVNVYTGPEYLNVYDEFVPLDSMVNNPV